MTISSPALTFGGPNCDATRLMPSVVPRTKIISRLDARIEELLGLGARLLHRPPWSAG